MCSVLLITPDSNEIKKEKFIGTLQKKTIANGDKEEALASR
jgi:hypothetical protein